MDLQVLGAGPAYTDRPGALGSSYLLVEGGQAIVLDLGQGTFSSLAQAIEPSTLLGVVISHLHPDHFIDLVALRHYLRTSSSRHVDCGCGGHARSSNVSIYCSGSLVSVRHRSRSRHWT